MPGYAGYSSRIPDLIMEGGRAQANARLQQGATMGQLLQQLGQTASELPGQIRDAQQQDTESKAKQAAEKQVQLAHELAAKHRRPDGSTDFGVVTNELRKAGAHDVATEIEKQWRAQQKHDIDMKSGQSTIAKTDADIANMGADNARADAEAKEKAAAQHEAQQRIQGVKDVLSTHAGPDGTITDWSKAIDAVRGAGFDAEAKELATSWKTQTDATAAQAEEGRKASEKGRRDAAQLMSRYTTAADYAKKREGLSPDLQALFPEAPPKSRRDLVLIGLTPKEEVDAHADQQRIAATAANADKGRLVQITGPGGAAIWVREDEAVGKPAAQAARSVTGAERQALAFFNRAKDAITTITPLEVQVSKMGVGGQSRLEWAPNMLQSELGQQYRQAQRAFTEARLRKESGAAIPTDEYTNDAKTYFAQPGDTTDTIKQKASARAKVLEGLAYSAGKAYEEFYGEPLATPAKGGSPFGAPAGLTVTPPAGWTIKAPGGGE